MNIDENILLRLTDEQKKKAATAQTPEELLALAREAGYKMSPEQLEAVSGGMDTSWCGMICSGRCSDECPMFLEE
jgi:hypothetical protein